MFVSGMVKWFRALDLKIWRFLLQILHPNIIWIGSLQLLDRVV